MVISEGYDLESIKEIFGVDTAFFEGVHEYISKNMADSIIEKEIWFISLFLDYRM
jgi:hypothetical protein